MCSYRDLYKSGETRLKAAGIAESSLDARLLLEFVMGTDRNYLLAHGEEPVDSFHIRAYEELIELRAAHTPLQYLTGVQEFMGLIFAVDERVLIPRQDTECLVEEAMIETADGMRVLDLCTGSGCIIISLMKYKNEIAATAVDISPDALAVAKKNADIHQVSVNFVESDLFAGLPVSETALFDVIVSNPPYIKTAVIETLSGEVKEHEPRLALDAADDGLYFYRKIISAAGEYLVRGGKLLFEIGYDQGKQVCKLMEEHGFADIRTVKDLAGLDRVVCGTYRK
ncbi:MAG TPA: peptide chain release factor N(5)-glutamine methyltransferase [Lachnospiraceae bacterium]|nr:peptide chain release factor N(5)-glutamine methyltransferase [Lachnospiraceae bacterium]